MSEDQSKAQPMSDERLEWTRRLLRDSWERAEWHELLAEVDRLRAAQRWIPCSERLPEQRPGKTRSPKGLVTGDPGTLGTFSELVMVAHLGKFVREDVYNYVTKDWLMTNPTHWMKLPAPPEDGR